MVNVLDNIIHSLISELFYYWTLLEKDYYWLIGFMAGFMFTPGLIFRDNTLARLFYSFSIMIAIMLVPGLYLLLPHIPAWLLRIEHTVPFYHIPVFAFLMAISAVLSFYFWRYSVELLDKYKTRSLHKNANQRDMRTDIRTVKDLLPYTAGQYDPQNYFNAEKGIFIGVNRYSRPVYIDYQHWCKSHVQILGTTGVGKGVLAGVTLFQAINHGETVIVIDPKNDEFLPHVLAQAAKRNGVPFNYIDLTGELPQWHIFTEKTAYEIEELLSVIFGLGDKGTDADYYRIIDRRVARAFAIFSADKDISLRENYRAFAEDNAELLKESRKFAEEMEGLIACPVVNTNHGIQLSKIVSTGSVVYVRGSMRNPRIQKLQKMFVLSVIQHCESRSRDNARQVCLFLDEFKYLITRPALEALGAIRDKRAHVMLAHQSLGDLRDCPDDINPQSVISSINENCAIKVTYKINDPDTADWLARMSGRILVDDEIRTFQAHRAMTETTKNERTLKQGERYLIDTNMLQSLPERCAVMYGQGLANYVFTSPIRVVKQKENIKPTIYTNSNNDETKVVSINKSQNISVAEDMINVD